MERTIKKRERGWERSMNGWRDEKTRLKNGEE